MAERIELWPIDRLKPYANNARTHSEEQVKQIARSMEEFGFTNPLLVDSSEGIIAGHGRLEAAKELGLAEVPVIVLDHLSEAQRRAYVIADNQLALNAGWDTSALQFELSQLKDLDFDLSVVGFGDDELGRLLEGLDFEGGLDLESEGDEDDWDPTVEGYTQKVEIPVYEPEGEQPDVEELFDRSRTDELAAAIREAKLPDDIREFLLLAATRHTVFNFERIANFYAHADAATQSLMEDSALVIVDFQKAIERGFVKLNDQVDAAFREDYPDA